VQTKLDLFQVLDHVGSEIGNIIAQFLKLFQNQAGDIVLFVGHSKLVNINASSYRGKTDIAVAGVPMLKEFFQTGLDPIPPFAPIWYIVPVFSLPRLASLHILHVMLLSPHATVRRSPTLSNFSDGFLGELFLCFKEI
jgi:hypothetical protein